MIIKTRVCMCQKQISSMGILEKIKISSKVSIIRIIHDTLLISTNSNSVWYECTCLKTIKNACLHACQKQILSMGILEKMKSLSKVSIVQRIHDALRTLTELE